ncbi:Glutamyl-tRNA(Gln) amidotransferase subunit A [Candidatus Hodgkinia cicadicola]|nr:Glutamyl-tRNA(Gln) amidotransferase subunit A [Candidatus Hodgkinia cicadicola]
MKAINAMCLKHSNVALILCLALSLRAERLDWYFRINAGCNFERALTRARARQRNRKRVLFGFNVSVKELLLSKDGFAEASSMMLSGFVSAYDSEVLTRLRRAGASVLCRANMDEFGVGSDGSACAHGYIVSAWARAACSLTREVTAAGGSSGGCASAVALRVSTVALATDTGGSVRQPASYVGVIGLKPSYGRCSRWGVLAYASSLDQVGVLTRSARDCARVCAVVFGKDLKDWTSVGLPVPKFELYISDPQFDLTRCPISALVLKQQTPCFKKVWTYCLSTLARVGFELMDADVPFADMVIPCYSVLTSVECCSNFARYNGIRFGLRLREVSAFLLYKKLRTVAYSAEVKRKLFTCAYVLSTRLGYERYYLKAQRIRFIIKSCLVTRLCDRNVLASLSVPASRLNVNTKLQPNALTDVYTVLASLTGLPSISVPTCFSEVGLPFGIQLIAGAYRELELIIASAMMARVNGVPSLCR